MASKEMDPGPLTSLESLPESTAMDLWDRTEKRSILNLVPPAIQSAFIDASNKDGDLFGLDEKTLFKKLREQERGPTPTDNRLRLAFWLEYDLTQTNMKAQMNMTSVFAGVCTRDYFYRHYIHNSSKVAWMLTPPVSYTVKIEEALDFGMDRMRDILELPVVDTFGKVNTKLAELQAKIVAMLDQRAKGSVTQRIEQKTMSLNVSTSDKNVATAMMENSMEVLERRLKELERHERRALNLPAIKEDEKIEDAKLVESDS